MSPLAYNNCQLLGIIEAGYAFLGQIKSAPFGVPMEGHVEGLLVAVGA